MAKVKIDRLQPGMIVGTGVKNMDGMLLMPSGCELSERHIRILQTWGIPEISVQSEDGDAVAATAPVAVLSKAPLELVRKLKARFWQFEENNPVQQEILRLLLRRKSKAIPGNPTA